MNLIVAKTGTLSSAYELEMESWELCQDQFRWLKFGQARLQWPISVSHEIVKAYGNSKEATLQSRIPIASKQGNKPLRCAQLVGEYHTEKMEAPPGSDTEADPDPTHAHLCVLSRQPYGAIAISSRIKSGTPNKRLQAILQPRFDC
jgi:hypothetical protein